MGDILTVSKICGQNVSSCNQQFFAQVGHLLGAQCKQTQKPLYHLLGMTIDRILSHKMLYIRTSPSKDFNKNLETYDGTCNLPDRF